MNHQAEVLKRYNKYRNDPIAFLTDCVYTLDQVDQKNPVKKFPIDYEYLKFYVKLWQKYPLIAIPKSRRMTMSWINIALYLHDTVFHTGRFNALVSKKEDDARELIEKAKFIFEHIPEDKIPKTLLPKMKEKSQPPILNFPELNSKLQGFPMGADQLRQFTFSGILGDEVAFWPEAQKFYSASLPTLEGGGRASFISSPAPGFFKKIVFDTVNSDIDLAQAPEGTANPMQGIRVWVNPNNRFLVCEIHYTANPLKRSEEYRLSIEKSMPRREYLQEYELNWDSFEGLPVYADFVRQIHLSNKRLEPQIGLPLLLGHDFGLTPSCVVGQMQGDQLVILREYVAKNKPTSIFIPEVMRDIQMRWPAWNDQDKHFRHFVDPSGNFRKDTDANTCVLEMSAAGLKNIIPGDVTWEKRRGAVDSFLRKHTGEGPGILMYEPDCPMLVKGFSGGYHYPESYGEIEPGKLRPLKNEFSHCFPEGTKVLTKNGEVNIEDLKVGDKVLTPIGVKKVTATMNSFSDDLVEIRTKKRSKLICTANHPIWSGNSFVRADALQYSDSLTKGELWEGQLSKKFKNIMELSFIRKGKVTSKLVTGLIKKQFTCIDMFGSKIMAKFQKECISIISMATNLITDLKILRLCVEKNTFHIMERNGREKTQKLRRSRSKSRKMLRKSGTGLKREENGTESTQKGLLSHFLSKITNVFSAEKITRLKKEGVSVVFAEQTASQKQEELQASTMWKDRVNSAINHLRQTNTASQDSVAEVVPIKVDKKIKVYDLTVEDAHCFFANKILVSNCHDALQYLCGGVLKQNTRLNKVIPTPKYGFSKSEGKKMSEGEKTGASKYGYKKF